MISPKASHTTNLIRVTFWRCATKKEQDIIASRGTTGENGTLKLLSLSGSVLLKTITDADTIINAASVPTLVNSETIPIGVKPATAIVIIPTRRVLFTGVWNFKLTCPKTFGSSPSLDIANNIRVCPNIITIKTEVKPQIAPTEISAEPHL